MLYRLRFDGYVGGIFKRAGYASDAVLDIWPVGRTLEWVQKGKQMKLKPVEAAALSLVDLLVARIRNGSMGFADARDIARCATAVARENGCRREVLQLVGEAANTDLIEAASGG